MEWGEDAHIANKTGHQSHTWGDVRAQLIRAHGGNARGRAARAHAALSTPQRDRQPRRKRGRCKPPRSQSDHRLQLATQRTRTPARARTCYIHRRRVNAWHRRRVRRGIADTHQHNATTHNNQCINTRADHRCHRPTTHPPRPRAPEHSPPPPYTPPPPPRHPPPPPHTHPRNHARPHPPPNHADISAHARPTPPTRQHTREHANILTPCPRNSIRGSKRKDRAPELHADTDKRERAARAKTRKQSGASSRNQFTIATRRRPPRRTRAGGSFS